MNKITYHIGDWVYYETHNGTKRYARICEFLKASVGIIEEERYRSWFLYEDVKPIPITPQTLEMFGFRLRYNGNFMMRIDDENCIFIENEDKKYVCKVITPMVFGVTVEVNVNYIHEIQHCMEVAKIENSIKIQP